MKNIFMASNEARLRIQLMFTN